MDSTWLETQFGDPRLNEDHNLIAFYRRAANRTLSRRNGKRDSWTDAAADSDIAFAVGCIPHHTTARLSPFPSVPFIPNPTLRGRMPWLNMYFSKGRSGCRQHTSGRVRGRVGSCPTIVVRVRFATLYCTHPVLSSPPPKSFCVRVNTSRGAECARPGFHMWY